MTGAEGVILSIYVRRAKQQDLMPLISQPSKTWIKKEEGLPRGKNGQPRFQKLPAAETGVGVNNPLTAPT